MIKIERVLVPTDFSDYSELALQYGVSFCREYGAEMILLHVLEDPFYPATGASFGFDMSDFFTRMEAETRSRLEEIASSEAARDIKIQPMIVRGTPFLEIIRVAKERDVDMVVLATHGRTGLAHVLMGSVTEKVVRKAPCPVLVVREAQHEFIMP